MEYKNFKVIKIENQSNGLFLVTVQNYNKRAYKSLLLFVTDNLFNLESLLINNVEDYLDDD